VIELLRSWEVTLNVEITIHILVLTLLNVNLP